MPTEQVSLSCRNFREDILGKHVPDFLLLPCFCHYKRAHSTPLFKLQMHHCLSSTTDALQCVVGVFLQLFSPSQLPAQQSPVFFTFSLCNPWLVSNQPFSAVMKGLTFCLLMNRRKNVSELSKNNWNYNCKWLLQGKLL